ncbi:MAG TPA: 7-cyano-7-deazaguanine synthase [Gemmataceae bacterium]|jgi:7-cyano-7-deazaguanine synthase|nr:7-cyano-7-deazaguanine synthase [Gemmataceae bacterium]
MGTADCPTAGAILPETDRNRAALAVLISGGLDSAILLGESLRSHEAVHPLYVRTGLSWEGVELGHLRQFLEAVRCPALQPLQVLELPVADLYGSHWSITGRGVPDEHSPDDGVFLPGRNVLLLSKALLWCHLHGVPAVALAVLDSNPFPDATPAFFAAYQEAVNLAVGGGVRVWRPYSGLSKTEVLRRGRGLPLGLTFSCIHPVAGRHCGHCNKCAERRRAFAAAALADGTAYAPAAGHRPSREHSTEESCTG